MTIKEFLEHNPQLKLQLQHFELFGGSWSIKLYNTTMASDIPVFENIITDEEINKLNVSFEEAIMMPVEIWHKECIKRYRKWLKEFRTKEN